MSERNDESPLLFNFEDIKRQADDYLNQVRQKAREILENAVAEAEAAKAPILAEAQTLREKAAQEGYLKGLEQGREESKKQAKAEIEKTVQSEMQTELQPALALFQTTLDHMANLKADLVATWEKAFLRLVCRVAERVIRQELRQTPNIEAGWIRESLELCSGARAVSLRLHPDDVSLLRPTLDEMQTRFRHLGTLEIREDATLTRGDCVVETEHGQIDQSITVQLERIAEELES